MEKPVDDKIQEIDKQIIWLYNEVGKNNNKSLYKIKKQINLLSNQTILGHSKIYEFKCCGSD